MIGHQQRSAAMPIFTDTVIRTATGDMLTAHERGGSVVFGLAISSKRVTRDGARTHATWTLDGDQARALLLSLADTMGIGIGLYEDGAAHALTTARSS
jgi:hypothetical protein